MTPTESRHLDAEIAAAVFGCRVAWQTVGGHSQPCCDCRLPRHGASRHGGGLPRCSEDVVAAFVVAKEVHRRFPHAGFHLDCHPWQKTMKPWGCHFNGNVRSAGNTASEAICRAALAAVKE